MEAFALHQSSLLAGLRVFGRLRAELIRRGAGVPPIDLLIGSVAIAYDMTLVTPNTADFLPLYHFGLLTSIAMLAGMIGDVVLLPCLLRTFDNVPSRTVIEQSNIQSTIAGAV